MFTKLMLAALLTGGALSTTACEHATAHNAQQTPPVLPSVPTSFGEGTPSSGDGATAPIRFVDVTPPGSTSVDVVSGDPATGTVLLSDLASGDVSDYVPVPTTQQTWLVQNGHTIGAVTYPTTTGDRMTVVVGLDRNGDGTHTSFEERNGTVTDTFGDVGTEGVDLPSGKAMLFASGVGLGAHEGSVELGQPGKGCLDGPDQKGDVKSTLGTLVNFWAEPGTQNLAWFTDLACAKPMSTPLPTSLGAGQEAYAIAHFADDTHLALLYVPVTAAGGGKDGVSDSTLGPTYDPQTGTVTS